MPYEFLKNPPKATPLTRDSYKDSEPDIRALIWGLDPEAEA